MQLVRFPAVFTAMADICLGFLLVRRTFDPTSAFVLLLISSSCLYLAGMIFNDVFDREVDARERPQRPIPSGRVSVGSAVRLGILLVFAGIGAAGFAGTQSLLVALLLTIGIFAYDGFLKRTALGPISMGFCRLLNVLLGASVIDPHASFALHVSLTDVRIAVLARPQLPVAACLGVYVVGVTWFARREAGISSRKQLAGAAAVINLGLGGLIVFLITGFPGLLRPWPGEANALGVLLAMVIIALILNRRLIAAMFDPVPQKVQPAVKTLLMSIIVLDAIIVFYHTNSPAHAIATALLIIPAVVLGRWVFVT